MNREQKTKRDQKWAFLDFTAGRISQQTYGRIMRDEAWYKTRATIQYFRVTHLDFGIRQIAVDLHD